MHGCCSSGPAVRAERSHRPGSMPESANSSSTITTRACPANGVRPGRAARFGWRRCDGASVHVVALVVAGGHGPGVPELVDSPFNGVALPVADLVEYWWPSTPAALADSGVGLVIFDRDHRLDAPQREVLTDRAGGIRLVSQGVVGSGPGPTRA